VKHAIVVGAGVVGLCSADALMRRGFRVTVLERDSIPGSGCSYGNGGLVVPSHFEPLAAPGMVSKGLKMLLSRESPFGFHFPPSLSEIGWIGKFIATATRSHVARCAPILCQMNLASRELFESRFGDMDFGYSRTGELMVCRTAAGLESEKHVADAAKGLGLQTEVLDRAGLATFESGVEIEAEGAVYFQDDAYLTPKLFMDALRARLIAGGAEIRDGAEVHGLRMEVDEVRATLADSEVVGDELVLAAGSWTGKLAEMLGLKMPLLGGKGYGMTLNNAPKTPKYPAILTEGRVAVTPMRDGIRFVGTMELGCPNGLGPTPAKLRGMRRTIQEAYPSLRDIDLETMPIWSGFRPCAPDGMPYIGRSRGFGNVTFATGHGMMGMSLGPVTGELVSQIVAGDPLSICLDLVRPDRYA
jgi:D-amino-acid dehydrogenase